MKGWSSTRWPRGHRLARAAVLYAPATARALRDAGGDVRLYECPGEGHRFHRAWSWLMHRTVTFLHARLG